MLKQPEIVWVNGPTGRLETIAIPAQTDTAVGVAVINHPNPTQGGTNTNKVIQTVAKSLSKQGYHCYLPNLRGVGNSDGVHDYGVGEVEDVLAVIAYAQAAHPEAAKLTVAGFSFGGYVSANVAQRVDIDHLIFLAAAMMKYERHASPVPHPERVFFVHGNADDVVELEHTYQWCRPQGISVMVVPEAGHFFHGRLIELGQIIDRYGLS